MASLCCVFDTLSDQRRSEVLERCDALVWDRPTIRAWALRCPALVQNMLWIAVVEHIAWLVSMHISLVEGDARGRVAHAGGSIEVVCVEGGFVNGPVMEKRSDGRRVPHVSRGQDQSPSAIS